MKNNKASNEVQEITVQSADEATMKLSFNNKLP